MDVLSVIEEAQMKTEGIPEFGPGDTVRVHVKVIEGGKERVQAFEGMVIKRRGRGTGETFTVRRVTNGVGVERTFLLHSPRVDRIEVRRRGKVRRARLYYLRDRIGSKATRVKDATRR